MIVVLFVLLFRNRGIVMGEKNYAINNPAMALVAKLGDVALLNVYFIILAQFQCHCIINKIFAIYSNKIIHTPLCL